LQDIADAVVEIPVRVCGMSQMEFPAFVEAEVLTGYGLSEGGGGEGQ